MERLCCCIPDQSDLSSTCQKLAEYQIWTGSEPDDYTESCLEHIPLLMSDAPVHRIEKIPEYLAPRIVEP